jgi:hypothetical protein
VETDNSDLRETILALETQRIGAMVRQEIETLDVLLGDDLSYTHSGGYTDTKSSFVARIREGRGHYLGVDYSEAQVLRLAGDSAVVRGRAQIRLEDTPGYHVFFLDVWTLRDGAWKMVAWQATRIPG